MKFILPIALFVLLLLNYLSIIILKRWVTMMRDPVCGMQVSEDSPIKLNRDGQDYFFCSEHCKELFISQDAASACCVPHKGSILKNKAFIISVICLALVLGAYFIPFLIPFRNSFLSYLKSIWWAVLFGLALGGVIDYYIPQEYISKVLSKKRPSTIFNAVFLGFLMSACSHGILAITIQIHKKGASNPAVVSFLLASPWANFAITMMLISLFGIKGLFIILAALVVAINTGFIFMFLEKKKFIESNKNTVSVAEDFSIIKDFKVRAKDYKFSLNDIRGIIKGSVSLSDMVLWWILLGVLIASLAGAYIPVHYFHKFMGPTLIGLLVTLGLATIIEVCSEGSSPLAFEIYKQTGALGNSFVFLMAGVATDYTEIGLLWTNVGRRVALWMVIVSVPQIILIGYLTNLFLK